MATGTLTSANSILALGAVGLFPSPVVIQGFEVDDGVLSQAVSRIEQRQGLDGTLVAGKVFNPYVIDVHLMPGANDQSLQFFETVAATQEGTREVVQLFGTLEIPAIGRSYEFVNGYLTSETPFAAVRKTLQPIVFQLTFEQINPNIV